MNENNVEVEARQLSVLAQEIEQGLQLPPTQEEREQRAEDIRQQDINSASMDIADTQYTEAIGTVIEFGWSLAFPNWQLSGAEIHPMANLTRLVIDKHLPNMMEKAGPEVALASVVGMTLMTHARSGVPPRGALPAQGGENEQG